MLELQALVAVGSVFVPPCLVLLAGLGWYESGRRGRSDLQGRWALLTVAAVLLMAWAWASFSFMPED